MEQNEKAQAGAKEEVSFFFLSFFSASVNDFFCCR
jgi:hypothetical protein